MTESVFVNVTGTAFSLLLYENIRNNCDQEGFLLGEISTNKKRTITDNDQEVVIIEHVIRINSVLPCPRLSHFFNNAGKVNAAKIEEFVEEKKNRIISWYKFKRTSSFKLTLREKIVMKELATYIMPQNPERFTFCLLTSQMGSESGATHIFSQTFIRHYKSAYHSLPMHINNLKDPHDVYINQQKCSALFNNIVKSLKIGVKPKAHGYAIVDKIETSLDTHIEQLVDDLKNSEAEMFALERRVRELRGRLSTVEDEDLVEELELDKSSSNQSLMPLESSIKTDMHNKKCKSEDLPTPSKGGRTLRTKRTPGNSPDIPMEQTTMELRSLRNSNVKKS